MFSFKLAESSTNSVLFVFVIMLIGTEMFFYGFPGAEAIVSFVTNTVRMARDATPNLAHFRDFAKYSLSFDDSCT